MKFAKKHIMAVLFSIYLPLASAATNIMPSFSEGWAGVPADVQTKIKWLLGIGLVGLVVVAVLYSVLSGGGALFSSHRGDVAGRSSGISNMFLGVAVVFVALIAVALVLFLVS